MNVAIMTTFAEFNPGYSLTGIVQDQCLMLRDHGHHPRIVAMHDCKTPAWCDGDVLAPILPPTTWVDYGHRGDMSPDHAAYASDAARAIVRVIHDHSVGLVFTHDWLFTGWNLPMAEAVRVASMQLPGVRWLHWVHSIPNGRRDWWDLGALGPRHELVYPNSHDAAHVADQFGCHPARIRVIPHIRDPRSWLEMDPVSCRVIAAMPGLLSADMVQVYPASTDRLMWKGLTDLVQVNAAWKRSGGSVCLLVANQWATGRNRREDLRRYGDLARLSGLESTEFAFLSDLDAACANGASRRVLRELMTLANVFVYPTHHESFGLVGPEAALSGALVVRNAALPMMAASLGPDGPSLGWPSWKAPEAAMHSADAYATQIRDWLMANPLVRQKDWVRRNLNWDAVYAKHYAPMLEAA